MHYPIEFQFLSNELPKTVGCAVFGMYEGGEAHLGVSVQDESLYADVIKPLLDASKFSGKKGSVVSAHALYPMRSVIVVGLGKKEALDAELLRQIAGQVYREAVKLYSSSLEIYFEQLLDSSLALQAFVEGMLLCTHYDDSFKSQREPEAVRPAKISFVGTKKDGATIELAEKIVAGVGLARALVTAPANHVTPTMLAQTAQNIAEQYKLEVKILEREDCKRLGMGAYLSVTQGSDEPPKFIHLTYKPTSFDASPFQKIALIGKGVTFDSGGLNLKTGASQIELMKYDMAGAAALLGAAKVVGAIRPNKEIHFIIAATENMINGRATKPGDIVTASNGKTIEIDNTDAEGRLTLADALVYAEQLGVDAIVDLATLTGAIVVALGPQIAGLFGTDEKLLNSLMAAAPRTGEKIWKMPLEQAYFDGMRSIVADMCNTGDRQGGGSITAALFLQQFVKETAWAHLDVAGPVWAKQPSAYHNAGGTGFGVRLLVDWILNS